MLTEDKIEPLRQYYKNLVPGMSAEGWEICRKLLSLRNVKKREFISREGQVCNHVSFITKGLVRLYHMKEERENIIGFCNEYNYIADYQSFLMRRPSEMFVQAMEDTELLETTYEGLQEIYRRVPEANLIGRLIAEKLFMEMCENNLSTIKETIEQRYYKLLDQCPWLPQRVPQYMIASYLGITPEAFSRIKSRLVRPRQPVTVG